MQPKPQDSLSLLNDERLDAFTKDQDPRKDVHSCHFYSKLYWRLHSNFIRKRNNGIQIRKEEVEVSLITVEMILYIEIPKESSETLLELMSSPNLQNTRPIKKINTI